MTFRAIFQSKWFTVGGLAALVFLGIALARRLPSLAILQWESARIQEKINDTQWAEAELKEKQAHAQSDDYLERQARLQLNYKKPGEEVVYVYHRNQNLVPLSLAKPRSHLQQWLKYLMGD